VAVARCDKSLFLRLKNRADRDAWDVLRLRLQDRIYRQALNKILDEHFADEVVQEVWLGLWKRIPDLIWPGEDDFERLVWTLTRDRAVDLIRREERFWKHLVALPGERAIEQIAARTPPTKFSDEWEQAREHMKEHLTPRQFEVVELHCLGWTVAQVAEHLRVSEKATRKRLHDGFERVRFSKMVCIILESFYG
jgi:RNA polymerase sigma factor (sigma-70 family)